MELHWELAVVHPNSDTETIETFKDVGQALAALKKAGRNHFIDLWTTDSVISLEQEIHYKDVRRWQK